MALEKPRLIRLSSILTHLQSRRMVTAKDIAEKHGVSIRTVYRDIKTLEESGVPIVTEEGKGYTMMEGYTLPPIMLSQDEANALITAEKIIQHNKDRSLVNNYQRAVTKIKSILRSSQKEKTELLENRLQIRSYPEENTESDALSILQSALVNYRVIKIDYVSQKDVYSQREIEPFALFSTKENWVLVAFCRLRKDFRAFRLDRIKGVFSMSEHFKPHQISLSDYFELCRKKNDYP